MSFLEAFIRCLIGIAVLMLVYFGLFDWFLPAVGIAIPAVIRQIVLVIFVLIAILFLLRFLWPFAASSWGGFWGPRPPGT